MSTSFKSIINFRLFLFVLVLTNFSAAAQIQIGNKINGAQNRDRFGNSVSMPDQHTMAIGAPDHGAYGHARIYQWSGNSWIQKGGDLDGETSGDQFGFSVSMPDSNTVAVGDPMNDGNGTDAGHVRVYRWNGSSWIQKGGDIDGEATGDESGFSVSMPDSNTVAIGAPFNGGTGVNAGHVRIYRWNGSTWIQKGNDIDGERVTDESGYAISMPNANTIAIGGPNNAGNILVSRGHVRIYRWNGSAWVQKGNDIDGEAFNDQLGFSVSMPNENTIAIGAPFHGNYDNGYAQIYRWNGYSWVQKGADIDGMRSDDRSGYSISMPNANTVAVGAPYHFASYGRVVVYKWNGVLWSIVNEVTGWNTRDFLGTSVSMPNYKILATGAPGIGTYGNDEGYTKVYAICNSIETISVSACNNYTSPSGKYNWITSGTYQDTIPNSAGCDSAITINLTINNKTTAVITETACERYTSPSGKYNWTSSGTYKDTIPNSLSCDSVITIHLTVNDAVLASISDTTCDSYESPSGKYTWTSTGSYLDTIASTTSCIIFTVDLTVKNSTKDTISPIVCGSYTSPSGSHNWTTSGTYQDTLVNSVGCDSLITINLTVNNSTVSTINPTACGSYTSPSGKYTWTSNGTFKDTIPNANGCDSIITINLTVNPITHATISATACDSYQSPSGKYVWTTSGTYLDTLPGTTNCIVFTINLTILNSTTASISPVACDNYTSPSGKHVWTTSGTYKDTIPNAVGCDSIITVNLNILNSTSTSISPTVCYEYTSPSGNYTWVTSGTYQDTMLNSVGCDSLITINLTVNDSSSASISPVVCENYTSPSGKYTWITSGTYQDTIQNSVGCDSLITINLTVNNNSSATIAPTVCDIYVSPSSNYTWTTSGTYQDTIANVAGCDSMITINLTVNNSSSATISQNACSTYTSPSGKYTWTSTGTYSDTIPNFIGCDSIITVHLTIQNTTANISPVVCNDYMSPSGNYFWSTSGTYQDTILNSVGCDSLITINLTVKDSTSAIISPVVCESYTSPSGNYVWTSSGIYSDVITNSQGCDSILTINLTVNGNSTATITPTVCDNYVSPSGNYNWTTSGSYQDTIANVAGCDSLITINLTVNNSNSVSISPTVCESYTSPSGKYTWTSNGTYTDTIPNTIGCDSIITVHLTIQNSTATITPTVCDNYVSPSGNYNWTTSGTYQDTIPNAASCDSIITINLTVNQTARSTVSATACDTYLSPSGNYSWSTTGTYLDTISTTAGCDSIITINLTIDTINPLATISNDSLIATDTSSTYQWLDCGNNYSSIPGATSRVFEPTVSGNYAISLDKLSCKDTSVCYSIVITGLQASKNQEESITIYPNPSNGLFTIDYPFSNESKVYTVSDINGKIVQEGLINKDKTQLNLSEFVSGIYLLRIEDTVVKLVLN